MGKKGKDKLAKMSEEERARYLQLRADIEEEARRRKIQLLSIYMKNKLKREDAFCRLNMAKINQEWRSILRQVKCQELQSEMIEVERFFKEQLDRRGQTIDRLLNELDMAEDMYGTLQQSHLETVNQLIATQEQRVNYFKDIYSEEKKILLNECQEDFEHFKHLHNDAQEKLECVKFHLEDRAAQQLNENHERHLKRLDDIRSTMHLRLEESTIKGEEKLEALWHEYQNVMANYVRHTETFYAEYVDLKVRDEESTAIIREHCQEIERATDQLSTLKLSALNVEEKNEIQQSYLEKIRNDLNTRLDELKKRFTDEINKEHKRFKHLSVESHYALKNLQNLLNKGDILMQLANVCRKYETEHEQLLPLGMPKQMFEHTNVPQWPPQTNGDEEYDGCSNWKQMENFWVRVNNATIDVMYLSQQKQALSEENARLKRELQDYMVTLNLSNGSNLHINDYLAKRPHSMCVDRVRQIDLANKHKKSQSAHVKRSKYPGQPSLQQPLPQPPPPPHTAPYVEANFTNTVRASRLIRGKLKLAKISTIANW